MEVYSLFQSTRLSRTSTLIPPNDSDIAFISIHKALASLHGKRINTPFADFNPQGSREPRLSALAYISGDSWISIHKALASLDMPKDKDGGSLLNFNPQGSREPRPQVILDCPQLSYFNPQGSREPRRHKAVLVVLFIIFQSTRLSRASTSLRDGLNRKTVFQSTRLSRASTTYF